MNTKTLAYIAVVAVVAAGMMVVARRKPGTTSPKESGGQPAPTQAVAKADPTPTTPPVETRAVDATPAAPSEAQRHSKQQMDAAQTEPAIKINGYEVQDPLARIALAEIGSDPAAEEYWIAAINDASLPPEERKDLIEDLNEVGLADPHHLTAQDAPLILRRIRLIEELAPSAMDAVNHDALAEAYKDLVGLANGQEPQ